MKKLPINSLPLENAANPVAVEEVFKILKHDTPLAEGPAKFCQCPALNVVDS